MLRDTLSTTNSAVNCGEPKAIVRGVSWLKIVRYKNIELTLTTRQLHSRELFAAAALPAVKLSASHRRHHVPSCREHGPVTHRAASGVTFLRVLGAVEERYE